MPCTPGRGRTGGVSGTRAQSLTNRLWESLSANVYVFLHQTRLSDVVRNELTPCPAVPSAFSRGGRGMSAVWRRGRCPSDSPEYLRQMNAVSARLSGLECDDAAAARGTGGDGGGDGCGGQPVLGPCRGAGGQGADREGAGAGCGGAGGGRGGHRLYLWRDRGGGFGAGGAGLVCAGGRA